MAKKNAIVAPRTPEALMEMTNRAQALTNEIHNIFADTSRGFLKLAPLMAEVREKGLYTMLGYKNIDDYATFEHGMSHGTVVGLNKVYARFGSTNEDKTEYRIPDQYLEWGYTKLHLFVDSAKEFEEAGISPLDDFKPEMTIKEMRTTLAQRLALKDKEAEENAIDVPYEEKETSGQNEDSKNPGQNEDSKKGAKSDFSAHWNEAKTAIEALTASYGNMDDTTKGQFDLIMKTLDTIKKHYNPKKSK